MSPVTVFEIICLCRARPIKQSLRVLLHSLQRLPNLAQSHQRCCLISMTTVSLSHTYFCLNLSYVLLT